MHPDILNVLTPYSPFRSPSLFVQGAAITTTVEPQVRLEVIEWVSGGSLSHYRSFLLLFLASISFVSLLCFLCRGEVHVIRSRVRGVTTPCCFCFARQHLRISRDLVLSRITSSFIIVRYQLSISQHTSFISPVLTNAFGETSGHLLSDELQNRAGLCCSICSIPVSGRISFR